VNLSALTREPYPSAFDNATWGAFELTPANFSSGAKSRAYVNPFNGNQTSFTRGKPKRSESILGKRGIELNALYARLLGPIRSLCPLGTTSIFRLWQDAPKNRPFEKKRVSIGEKINALPLQLSSADPSRGSRWRRQYA